MLSAIISLTGKSPLPPEWDVLCSLSPRAERRSLTGWALLCGRDRILALHPSKVKVVSVRVQPASVQNTSLSLRDAAMNTGVPKAAPRRQWNNERACCRSCHRNGAVLLHVQNWQIRYKKELLLLQSLSWPRAQRPFPSQNHSWFISNVRGCCSGASGLAPCLSDLKPGKPLSAFS